jgi:hypothetical protein
MAETEMKLQEEMGRCSGLAATHKVERRRRRIIQVMVPEFRALYYSQLLGANTLPIWSNKQLTCSATLNICLPYLIFPLHNTHTLL